MRNVRWPGWPIASASTASTRPKSIIAVPFTRRKKPSVGAREIGGNDATRAVAWRPESALPSYDCPMATTVPVPPADLGLTRDEPMSRHTYMRVGGPAVYFGVPEDRA